MSIFGRDCIINSNFNRDEHFNRSPDCTFFTLIDAYKQEKKTKSKRDRTSKASRLSTLSRAPTPSFEDLPTAEDSILTTTATATKGKKGKKGTTAGTRKTGASRLSTQSALTVASDAHSVSDLPGEYEDSIVTTATNATTVKKMPKAKAKIAGATSARSTRASRLSVQSVAPSEVPYSTESPVEDDDSIVTTATTATTTGKGTIKGKNTVVKKIKAKNVAPEEVLETLEPEVEKDTIPKVARGTKRKSEDYEMFNPEPVEIDEAAIEAELEALEAEPLPLPKVRGAKGKQTRKASAQKQQIPRESNDTAPPPAKRRATRTRRSTTIDEPASIIVARKPTRGKKKLAEEMTAPAIVDGASIMDVDEPESAPVSISTKPTRGNKKAADKQNASIIVNDDLHFDVQEQIPEVTAAKSTRSRKKKSEEVVSVITSFMPDSSTHVEVDEPAKAVVPLKSTRGRKKKSEDVVHADASRVELKDLILTTRNSSPSAVLPQSTANEASIVVGNAPKPTKARKRKSEKAAESNGSVDTNMPPPKRLSTHSTRMRGSSAMREASAEAEAYRPVAIREDSVASPQSSDAENRPPPPSSVALGKRPVPVDEVEEEARTPSPTPQRTRRIPLQGRTPMMSPSKRNVIAGLQSTHPWTSIDLDTVFMKSPDKENVIANSEDLFGSAAEKTNSGDLTSPEKKMTVEEWIKYNAQVAEEKLKNECERMVGIFETQGARAMAALDGIETI